MATRTRKSSKKTNISKQLKRRSRQTEDSSDPAQAHSNRGGLIPTGSTLANLAFSDNIEGGPEEGAMINVIGGSGAGKTIFSLGLCAEMAQHSKFDDWDFHYDPVEEGSSFNMEYMFGRTAAKRLMDGEFNEPSDTIQQWRKRIIARLKEPRPCVYILDSFDALTSAEEKARSSQEDESGTYKTEKAKISGEVFRQIIRELKRTRSLLIVISQERDNPAAGPFESKRIRSGGRALKFYSGHEVWISSKGKIQKTVAGQKKTVGNKMIGKVSKNRVSGKLRDFVVPIYYDYGLDDIGSQLDWLKEHEFLGKKLAAAAKFELLGAELKMAEHVKRIEDENLEKELQKYTAECWNNIENRLRTNRKKKYE